MQRSPNAEGSVSGRERRHGAVIMAAGGVWVIAGVLIVVGPAGLSAARVYGTAVPLAVALLLVGATGVRLRLGDPEQPPS